MRTLRSFWCSRVQRSAFSFIEFIGVAAIMAILGAALLPVVIRQMDQAARTKEFTDLNAISNAIVLQTLTTKTIPDAAGLAQAAASWTRFPVSLIATNNRRYARAFLIDTNGWFGTAAGSLPYTQTIGSTNAPTNARIMVLGTIATALPVASGALSAAAFDAIWNTPVGGTPSTWGAWPGKGEDLVIQRLNLSQLFYRLVVVNRDKQATSQPLVTIDANASMTVPADGIGQNRYLLNGTVVGLCEPSGTPMARFALTQDSSFVFEGSVWLDQILSGNSNEVMAQDFATLAAKFLASQWYPGAHQGGDQQGALVAMFNFMLIYGLWANQCPHFPWHSASSGVQVPEYELLFDIGGNGSSSRLNEFTGGNGLLK